ncbi:HD domain-containing protein [Clostridium sporogenes]|uniref:HD domain-containing protein n=1 Tax=Clostridium sporogenes TaxID=1509 RepID=UPI0013D2193F|nr:HD domain-containing protein [Clostridium sporogenes]NFE82451.1 HD domain-containing protein [Clostridium sporogenes]NFG68693.1 HD domain-containing protein [Clostridium sporogenes]
MKKIYIKEVKPGEKINSQFMILKKIYKDGDSIIAYIGDRTGDIKVKILDKKAVLDAGDVIECSFIFSNNSEILNFKKIDKFLLEDFLPTVDRPIEEIMNEIEEISKDEFKSKECIELNNYFFKDQEFLEKFKRGIGGVSQHHNYIGGLAEHTLNVMYLAKMLCYRYNVKNKELAILAAKLHDIGKTEELSTSGPFTYTLKGEMEGHIVIGVEMLQRAFNYNVKAYSEDFKQRVKACIIQHHGKVEYGSPRSPKLEESYVVHYADYIDANMNKIAIVKKDVKENTWSQYDRRIEGKIYV